MNVVTRSGTNNFHGGAFEYLRDRTFNSKGFFAAEKDFLKRNQYGGFGGGPIRRNSTFFFGGWQRTRITNRASELIRFVPTAAQRRGDFSNCTPACPQLYNPATGLPFANNQIPADLWDPAAVKVFAALPTSTLPNGQVTVPRGTGQDSNQFVAKVDQQLGANNQLSVRYFIDDFNNASQFLPENILSYTGPSLESDPRSQSIVTGWKRTLSSTLLNESTFGYNRLHTARRPHPDVPSTQDFGIRLPYYPNIPSVSEIRADGYFNFGDNLEASFPRDGFQFNNKTNWIKGRHGIPVRLRARVPAVRDLQRFPPCRALHLERPVHPCARRGQRRKCARRLPARQASARSIMERASTRTIETSISRTSSRTTSSSAIASR